MYLSCALTGAFSASVFASLGGPTIVEHDSPLPGETAERLLFLKTNLEHLPSYTRAPYLPQQGPGRGAQAGE